MTDAELIAWLRRDTPLSWMSGVAADRIEALIAERDEALEWLSASQGYIADAVYALDKQEAAEAKLAKAVKVLEDLVRDCEADYPPSHGAIKYFCRATLAEIKSGVATTPYGLEGESHE